MNRLAGVIASLLVITSCSGGSGKGGDSPDPDPGTFEVELGTALITLFLGSSAELSVSVTRTDFDAPLVLTATPLPTGVTCAPVTVDEGATEAVLTFVAASSATAGTFALDVVGTADDTTDQAPLDLRVRPGPGALDTSLSPDGFVTTWATPAGGNQVRYVEVLPTGEILAIGTRVLTNGTSYAASVHVLQDGTLDETYGDAGIALFPGGGRGVARQSDGKYVLGGVEDLVPTIYRMNADGTPDLTFGDGDGKVTFGPGAASVVRVIVQDDGKIVAVGKVEPGPRDTLVLRVDESGQPDMSFGGGTGYAVIDAGAGIGDEGEDVWIDPADGSIFVLIALKNGTTPTDIGILKLDESGTPDATFGAAGVVTIDLDGRGDNPVRLLPLDDGSGGFVVTGFSYAGSDGDFFAAWLTDEFTLDTSMSGGDGYSLHGFGNNNEIVYASMLTSDGHVLVSGFSRFGSEDRIALVRFDGSTGMLDPSFAGGAVLVDLEPENSLNDDYPLALTEDGEGRYVFGGSIASPLGGSRAVVGRIWN